jgi:hypothetical protein
MGPKIKSCRAKARECERRAEAAADRGVKRAYWRVAAQWSDMASKSRRRARRAGRHVPEMLPGSFCR